MYEEYARLRDLLGLKDADVAKATGLSRSTLSQWKAGKNSPKAAALLKIANCIKVPVDWLIEKEA